MKIIIKRFINKIKCRKKYSVDVKRIKNTCDICNKENEEFIIYSKNNKHILKVCQSCVSKNFRKFKKNK